MLTCLPISVAGRSLPAASVVLLILHERCMFRVVWKTSLKRCVGLPQTCVGQCIAAAVDSLVSLPILRYTHFYTYQNLSYLPTCSWWKYSNRSFFWIVIGTEFVVETSGPQQSTLECPVVWWWTGQLSHSNTQTYLPT